GSDPSMPFDLASLHPLDSNVTAVSPGRYTPLSWHSREPLDPMLTSDWRVPVATRRRHTVELNLHGGYRKQSRLWQLGILSLSERWDSLLMWSHYADSHRGLAIGLRTDHGFFQKRDLRQILMPGSSVMGGECYSYRDVPPLSKIMYGSERVTMLCTSPAM